MSNVKNWNDDIGGRFFLGLQKKTNVKMITELLEATLTEMMDSSFEISEFQLGEGPYNILKSEAESLVTGYKVDISKVNLFKGIPVSLHPSKDAVMYCLKFKNKMNLQELVKLVDDLINENPDYTIKDFIEIVNEINGIAGQNKE